MARCSIAAYRFIRRFSTASLLAAALVSPALHAQPETPVASTEAGSAAASEPKSAEAQPDTSEDAEAADESAEPGESGEISAEAERLLEQIKRDNPGLDQAILEQLKQQLKNLDVGDPSGGGPTRPHQVPADRLDAGAPEPDTTPDADVDADTDTDTDADALIATERQREEAEALITQLADAEQDEIEAIERSLAELGKASLVPLKLAALSDDFDLRTRAGAMARRLRWRLVCNPTLLDRYPSLPQVMAGEEGKPRREMIDTIVNDPSADDVPLFVECLADRDQYIRERGIDGLVLIGKTYESVSAGKALQQAALDSDDKSVVLLSVAGLGEIEQADIGVLTRLFEKTEHAEVQRTVLMTAGYTRNVQAVDLIERALKDPRWRVRAAGVEALEDIHSYAKSADLGGMITPLLTDPEPFIRANALRLVAEIKSPGTASTVWQLIEDGSIDESAGLETLASLQDSKAYQQITTRYENATRAGQHEDATRWLTYLAEYEKRESVNSLLSSIIQDTSLREQWPVAIYLASGRSKPQRFVPSVAPLLLDRDHEVRSTVWSSFGRYRMDDYELPTELDRGLAQGDTEQRIWRLNLIYQTIDINTNSALYDALDDEDPAVVNRALAMLGNLLVDDSLGEDSLPYRNTSTEYTIDRFGNHTPKPPSKPEMSEPAVEQVRDVLDDQDPLARVRAAALLYALDKDRGEKVNALLKAAIRSGVPGRVAAGLFAANTERGDLIQGVDLLQLSEKHRDDNYLLTHLCSVMLQVGDQPLIDAVLKISEDFQLYLHQDHFISLASSGSEPAVDLVKRKVLEEGRFYGRRMIQQMVETSPDAAIEIGAALLESPDLESYDRQDIINNLLRTEQNDKLIPLLKEQIKKASASDDEYEKRQAKQYQRMLLSIDPQSAQTEIIGTLKNGDPLEQQQAITTLIQMQAPGEKIAEMVLETLLTREKPVHPSWSMLVGWLKHAGQHAPLEQAVSSLPAPIQSALVADIAASAGPSDLARLLAIEPANREVRDRVTMAVAELTTQYPDTRPESLEQRTSTERVYLLAAAGQWPEGESLLRGWLDHEDKPTAAAALRGLAISRVLDSENPLDDTDANRFANGVSSDDAFTAYLSAEALYQHDKERLLAIDPAAVSSRLALLRIGCAGGGKADGPVADAIKAVLRNITDPQSTESRLALIAAIRSEQKHTFLRSWQMNRFTHFQNDLLLPALRAFKSSDMLYQAVYMGLASAEDSAVIEMVDRIVAESDGAPNRYLGMFIDRGLIETVRTEQIEQYLKSYLMWSRQGQALLGIGGFIEAFEGDPSSVKAELLKIMRAEDSESLQAAMLAYQLDQHEEAFEYLKASLSKLNTEQIERSGVDRQLHQALAVITYAGGRDNAMFLIELFSKIYDQDSWRAQSFAQQLLQAALMIEPNAVYAYYDEHKDQANAGLNTYLQGDPYPLADLLNAMRMDEADGTKGLIDPSNLMLSQQILSIKQGNLSGGAFATPPWDYYLTRNETDKMGPAELAELESELSLTWIRTGEIDSQKGQLYRQGIYDAPNRRWETLQTKYEQLLSDSWGLNYEGSAVFFNGLDNVDTISFYASLQNISSAVPLSDAHQASIESLAPLIESEDARIASRAVRVAAAWYATDLRDALADAIARPDAAGLEAAWASARLFGPEVLDAILQRAKSSKDYGERIELACLLTLLGEAQWSPGIVEEARRILCVQQLRGRALTPIQVFSGGGQSRQDSVLFQDGFHAQRGNAANSETIIDGRLLSREATWQALLTAVSGRSEDDALAARLDFAPAITQAVYESERPTDRLIDHALELRADVTNGMSFEDGATNNLPLTDLVGWNAPAIMRLEKQESALFSASLIQFSKQGMSGIQLESAWRNWLVEHGENGLDARWRAGVVSAIEALTDAKWWRRALARERLQRLTGQAIEQPALFDKDAWSSLQAKWRAWADSDQAATGRAALSAVAIQAGLIDTPATSDAEELEMLVQLASRGSDVQSTAALHRLNLWPDARGLLKAAEIWQTSPRAELRGWYLLRATDQPRIYVPAEAIE